jgi:hypothetical protein
MNAATLQRLRDGGADRFVDLLLDDLLDRPFRDLVDPGPVSHQLTVALRAAANEPRLETALRERLDQLRTKVPEGPLALPAEIREPLRRVLTRPYVPNREIVVRLLDHVAVHALFKHIFLDLLVAFAKKLRPPVPSTGLGSALGGLGGRSPLGALGKIGGGVLGAVGEEVERQVEQKAREFLDNAMHRLVERAADEICDPDHGDEYGAFRRHIVDTLAGTDAKVLASEVEKLDPEALVGTGVALLRAWANREETSGEVQRALSALLDDSGDRTAREVLGGAEDATIGLVRDLLRQRARALVETPAFAAWWDEMNAP